MSTVTNATATATATDPPPANSPILHSKLVSKDPRRKKITPMWHMINKWAHLFLLNSFWLMLSLILALDRVEVKGNMANFNYNNWFSFWAKPNFLKKIIYSTLYMLDLLGFRQKFGLFHYAKLSSLTVMKWGRLARPLPSNFKG